MTKLSDISALNLDGQFSDEVARATHALKDSRIGGSRVAVTGAISTVLGLAFGFLFGMVLVIANLMQFEQCYVAGILGAVVGACGTMTWCGLERRRIALTYSESERVVLSAYAEQLARARRFDAKLAALKSIDENSPFGTTPLPTNLDAAARNREEIFTAFNREQSHFLEFDRKRKLAAAHAELVRLSGIKV